MIFKKGRGGLKEWENGASEFKKAIKPSLGSQTTAATGLGLRKLATAILGKKV